MTPKIKQLKWRVQSHDCQVAETPWGNAAVQNESHAISPNRWGWWMVGSLEDDSPTGYETGIELAQAAAQADYAARIIAALDPVWLAALEAQVKAADGLAEALQWYADPEIYARSVHGITFDNGDLSYHAVSALTAYRATREANHE